MTVTWIERDLQFVKLIPLYGVKMHFSMALVRYNIKKYVFFGSPRDMLHTWSCSLSVSFSSLRVVICPCSDINWSDWLPIRENIIRRYQCWCKFKRKKPQRSSILFKGLLLFPSHRWSTPVTKTSKMNKMSFHPLPRYILMQPPEW